MCIFCDSLRTQIKLNFECELARIKHDYETHGFPLNYNEYYPAMVESLDRRTEEKLQNIARDLAGGLYNNPISDI